MEYLEQAKEVAANLAGIYLITNTVNNKHYIGQSIYLRKRLLNNNRVFRWPGGGINTDMNRLPGIKTLFDALAVYRDWETDRKSVV